MFNRRLRRARAAIAANARYPGNPRLSGGIRIFTSAAAEAAPVIGQKGGSAGRIFARRQLLREILHQLGQQLDLLGAQEIDLVVEELDLEFGLQVDVVVVGLVLA